jgi:hypothetical protein
MLSRLESSAIPLCSFDQRGADRLDFARSLLLSAGGVYLSLGDARLWPVSLFGFAAIPYWLTIRWVDRYGSWDGDRAR